VKPVDCRLGVFALYLGMGLMAGCRSTSSPSMQHQDGPSAEPIKVSPGPPENGYKNSTSYSLQRGQDSFQLISLVPDQPDFAPVLKFSVHGSDSSCALRSAALDFHVFQFLYHHLLAHEKPQTVYTLYTCYHEIDDRLPALAARSPEWIRLSNDKNISPQKQYAALATIVNQAGVLSELSQSLAPDRYQVRIASEDLEIIWTKAADLRSEQRQLLPSSIPSNQVLPSSISKTFLLTRESN
jgi:hypothetical protein